jgi:hypothetical protein
MITLARRCHVAAHLCAHAVRTQAGADALALLALEQPIETEADLRSRETSARVLQLATDGVAWLGGDWEEALREHHRVRREQ